MKQAKEIYDKVVIGLETNRLSTISSFDSYNKKIPPDTKNIQQMFENRVNYLDKNDDIKRRSDYSIKDELPISENSQIAVQHEHDLYRSVFSPEPNFTNWNNDFNGTLDYIFITPDLKVLNSNLIHSLELVKKAPHLFSSNGIEINGPFPSIDWPSDHLMLIANISFL